MGIIPYIMIPKKDIPMANIGYARVSSTDQDFDGQIERLKAAGCNRLFSEKVSGKSRDGRHALQKALQTLQPEMKVEYNEKIYRGVGVHGCVFRSQCTANHHSPSSVPGAHTLDNTSVAFRGTANNNAAPNGISDSSSQPTGT
jgi:hypothetical protein